MYLRCHVHSTMVVCQHWSVEMGSMDALWFGDTPSDNQVTGIVVGVVRFEIKVPWMINGYSQMVVRWPKGNNGFTLLPWICYSEESVEVVTSRAMDATGCHWVMAQRIRGTQCLVFVKPSNLSSNLFSDWMKIPAYPNMGSTWFKSSDDDSTCVSERLSSRDFRAGISWTWRPSAEEVGVPASTQYYWACRRRNGVDGRKCWGDHWWIYSSGCAADGGDIQLIKIEDNDVYVKLTGACQSCSSAIMTMKMGVEALLREEFPSMRELIDETEYAA